MSACATVPNLLTRAGQRAELISQRLRDSCRCAARCALCGGATLREGCRLDNTAWANIEHQVEVILRLHRMRQQILGAEIFGDPAWEILLQLYLSTSKGEQLATKDLDWIAPPTTLARWITVLEERGWVECILIGVEHTDLRMRLSAEGKAKMCRLFRDLRHPILVS